MQNEVFCKMYANHYGLLSNNVIKPTICIHRGVSDSGDYNRRALGSLSATQKELGEQARR